jgi:hypothetical protein
VLGLATGTWTHKTHHGPDSGVSHHLTPYSILCDWSPKLHPNGTFLLGLPKWSPETVSAGLPKLWTAITPRPELRSRQVLNQSCSSHRELSNVVSHSSRKRWEEVDSRLLVVGSQIASLTPGPSFAHNLGLGCRCLNCQCEAIFDIYVSRPFQWHQERLNARCFGPCCRALNIWESRRTPNLQFFQVLGFTPTLGQSGVATSHAFNYFIRTLESSKTRSNKFFFYPLTKLFEIWWMNKHGSFFSYCHDGVCTILKEVVRITRGFCPP